MAHDKNSKTEKLSLRIDGEMEKLLNLISDPNPKAEFCKSHLTEFFLKHGIHSFFQNFGYFNLTGLKINIRYVKQTLDNDFFNQILSRINSQLNQRRLNNEIQ